MNGVSDLDDNVSPVEIPAIGEPLKYSDLQSEWAAFHNAGKAEEAFLIACRALDAFPEEPLGYLGKCWFHFARSRPAVLLQSARVAASRLPDAYDPHFFICCALDLLEADDDLESAYKAAIATHPARSLGWSGAARLLRKRGKLDSALELLLQALGTVRGDELGAIVREYVSTRPPALGPHTSVERQHLIEASRQATGLAGRIIEWLVATCPETEKAALVDQLTTTFSSDDTLFEMQLRSRFDKRDYSLPEEAFVRYALRKHSSLSFRLLWIERLLGLGDLQELAVYISTHAGPLGSTDVGMSGAILLIDAIVACNGRGIQTALSIADIKTGDSRILRAIAAYRSGDPFLSFRKPESSSAIRPYIRLYSFIHQGWGVPITPFQAQEVSDIVIGALADRRPFSLIRLGDGEGNFLRWTTTTLINATIYRTAEHTFVTPEISHEAYQALHSELLEYLAEASILGIPNEFMAEVSEDWACVNRVLVDLPLQGVLTDHAAHYALAGYGCYERAIAFQLIAKLPIVYIGPHDPASFRNLAVPTDTILHWAIPGEAVYLPQTLTEEAHYPHYYHRILARIADLPAKSLVLISAGILGKFYAGAVKRKGGVALDIGAVSDQWAGHQTRIYAQQDGKVSAERMTLRDLLA